MNVTVVLTQRPEVRVGVVGGSCKGESTQEISIEGNPRIALEGEGRGNIPTIPYPAGGGLEQSAGG